MAIERIIEKFDNTEVKNFTENDISSELGTLINDKTILDEKLKYEIIAFDLAEYDPERKSSWGTYFGYKVSGNNDTGEYIEYPSLDTITPDMINFWEERLKQCKNPILIARYSGLIWDLKYKISGIKPSHETCRNNIQSILEIAKGGFYKYPRTVYQKLKRALILAIGLNDPDLVKNCVEVIISFEKQNADEQKTGTWGYAFDLLVLNSSVKLSVTEEKLIIDDLEQKLNSSSSDKWAIEAAGERLADYYRKKQKQDEVRRVLLRVSEGFEKASAEFSNMQFLGILERLHKLYNQFNLKDEAENVLKQIRELGPIATKELTTVSGEITISQDDINKYIDALTQGDIDDALFRIISQFIPNKNETKEQIFELSKETPLSFLINKSIQDEKGRIIAKIGSLEDDLDGNIIQAIGRNFSFSSLFLGMALKQLRDQSKLNKDIVLNFISKSPIIKPERFSIIEKGLMAYFSDDYIVAIHLLIPQIEESIRSLIEMEGGNVMKLSRGGAFHLKTFDDLLRDDKLLQIVGENLSTYFKALFTDPRGWNLRNDVCHGLSEPLKFNQATADRILHALLCLGLIIKEEG